MSFAKRLIDVTFTLPPGQVFAETGTDALTLSGLRVSAKIAKAGGPSMGQADVKIYGMTQSQMNRLATFGLLAGLNGPPRASMTISAGDADNGMAVIFSGSVSEAYIDYNSSPDVPFIVLAQSGLAQAVAAVPPSSFPGVVDVATAMSGFAALMGLSFENNGVTAKLPPSYFYGSARNQAKACAEDAGIGWVIDDIKLAIWPKGGSRGGAVPLVSPDTGLIGYPTFTRLGVWFRTVFNRSIGFMQNVQLKSSVFAASGVYTIFKLDHDLESLVPRGRWETICQGYAPSRPTPVAR